MKRSRDESSSAPPAAVAPAAAEFVVKRVVVTTDHQAEHVRRAQDLAQRLSGHDGLDAVFVEREGESLVKILARHDAEAVLVVGATGTLLRLSNGCEHKLHGGIGVLRLRNVSGGGADNMVEACGLRAGDRFIDATAGQLSDALVAAHVVGPAGRVLAIEASPLLHAVSSGRPVQSADARVDALLTGIEVVLGDHYDVLKAQPDSSADVVYFDPMFRRPQKSSSSFDVLRSLAHHAPLTSAVVEQAKRVARRRVVVMDQSGGAELERLGLTVVHAGQRKRYGIAELGTADARAAHSSASVEEPLAASAPGARPTDSPTEKGVG